MKLPSRSASTCPGMASPYIDLYWLACSRAGCRLAVTSMAPAASSPPPVQGALSSMPRAAGTPQDAGHCFTQRPSPGAVPGPQPRQRQAGGSGSTQQAGRTSPMARDTTDRPSAATPATAMPACRSTGKVRRLECCSSILLMISFSAPCRAAHAAGRKASDGRTAVADAACSTQGWC